MLWEDSHFASEADLQFQLLAFNLSPLEIKVVQSLRAEKRLEGEFFNIFAKLMASFIDLEKSVLVLQLIDFETLCRRHTSERAVTQILERTLAQHLRLKEDIKSVIIPVYFSALFAVYHISIHSSYIEVNLLNSLRHHKPSLREQDLFDSGLRRLGKFFSKSGFRNRKGVFFTTAKEWR